jgi:integrase
MTTFLPASDRADSTKTMHAGYARVWIIPVLGDVRLHQLNVNDVNRLMLTMKADGRAEATRRNCYTTLRIALDDAVTNGLLATNPVHRVRQPKVTRRDARFLRPGEVTALLVATNGLRYGPVLSFIVGTGLRRGEALALRWSQIDLDRGTARVSGSLIRREGQLVISTTKTATSRRTVALSPAMIALLRRWRAGQAAELAAAGNLWQGDDGDGFVFTTALGRPVEPQNILRTVSVAADSAGLDGVSVHTLRHTYATTALLNGVPLKVVSCNLGHASIQVTADIYGHVTDDAAQAAAATVANALRL